MPAGCKYQNTARVASGRIQEEVALLLVKYQLLSPDRHFWFTWHVKALDFLSPLWTLAEEGERPFFTWQLVERVRPIGGAPTKLQLASWVGGDRWEQRRNLERKRRQRDQWGQIWREREGTWRLQSDKPACATSALILIQPGHISHRAVCTKHTLSKAPNLQDCLPDKITPRQIIWGFIYFTHDIYGINYASLFFRGNALVPMLIGLSQSISWSNVTILWMPIQPIQRVSCKSVLRSTLY